MHHWVWKEWGLLLAAALLFLLALAGPLAAAGESLTSEEIRLWEAYRNDELIRLHVVANSDTNYDQSIKLAVRDAVISAFGDLLVKAGGTGSDAVFSILSAHAEDMQKIACSTARKLGFEGAVTAQAGIMELPEKIYGQVTLPKGNYRALKITLGKGEGKNWWCVLYPQLCLALSGSETPKPEWDCVRIFQQWLAFPVQTEGNVI